MPRKYDRSPATKGFVNNALKPLKRDVKGLKRDVSSLKRDVSGLKGDVSGLKGDVSSLRGSVLQFGTDLMAEMQAMETRIEKKLTHHFNVVAENMYHDLADMMKIYREQTKDDHQKHEVRIVRLERHSGLIF